MTEFTSYTGFMSAAYGSRYNCLRVSARATAIHCSGQVAQNPVEAPALGGLFELYTPEEYEESVNQIKKYMGF